MVMRGARAGVVFDSRAREKARQRARAFTLLAGRRFKFLIVVYALRMQVDIRIALNQLWDNGG
jgi:hypothetical protein